jgi:hypothetical protein
LTLTGFPLKDATAVTCHTRITDTLFILPAAS